MTSLDDRLRALLDDELLADVPKNPTLEDIEKLIAIEQGRAYRIKIDRGHFDPLFIIVKQAFSVRDVKKEIQRAMKNTDNHAISWKYIWRTYCLMTQDGQKRLEDDNAVVSQLGITQHTVLRFARRTFEKGKHRPAWRRRT
ncbi:hypothetical protein BX666DRAFT_881339 [Dichotomocladium elegans]|nr:hypothetical protein BX666DRAFT_881339 [Dichotomocladium elegans]